MTTQLIICTRNRHKLDEIREIFSDFNGEIRLINDIVDTPVDIIEDGLTFAENALKKVAPYTPTDNQIILAEDSGIEVDALDGRPGIYSARYAGENASREDMCTKLLNDLGTTSDRGAQYRAVMAIKQPNHPPTTVEGIVRGTIAAEMTGTNGFGYDPIFIPEGYSDTFGILPESVKHEMSHRARALEKLRPFLD